MRKIQITSLVFLFTVSFISCKKETNDNIDQLEKYNIYNSEATAQVKFVHAYTPLTINGLTTGNAATSTGTGFRITMDGTKLNGATNTSVFTNTLVYGGVYPATTAYAFLNPGPHNVKFVMNRIVSGNFAPTAADEVFSSTTSFTAGKKYSVFISDPYAAPATYILEDNYKEPNLNSYGVRFVNLCADAASRFDVVSVRQGRVIFSDVGYKEMRDYIYLPTTPTLDTILLRNAGTTTIVARLNGFFPGTQRVYTLLGRGKTGVTDRGPSITSYTNR